MAVRAEHLAFLELGHDLLPAPRDTVLTDPDTLVLCVQVMEVEQRWWFCPLAARATTAHVVNSADLQSATVVHHGAAFCVEVLCGMVNPVTVRAKHVALFGFSPQRLPRAREGADREPLGARVTMMEIERRGRAGITAIGTLTSANRDELRLQLSATLFQVPVCLGVATFPAVCDQLVRIEIARWSARSVVDSEGRATKAEASSVQTSDLAADHLLGREEPSASLAA